MYFRDTTLEARHSSRLTMEQLHLTPSRSKAHHVWFLLFSIVSLVFFRRYLGALVSLSLQDERYSYVLLIPIVSTLLVYLQRKRIFISPRYGFLNGLPLLTFGIALLSLSGSRLSALTSNDRLSVAMLSLVPIFAAEFVFCYGAQAFVTALFPWLFLLLVIPIPTIVLENIVLTLQEGSAVMTFALFKLLGVPVFWEHFKFLLPGVEIQIAKECSGIRSSLSLFITSILTGYIFLQSNWRKAFFSLFTIPVVIFKNAVRIVTISCLGVYVDPVFLHGKLHRYGGLPFSLVSLAILMPLLLVLQRGEASRIKSVRSKDGVSKSEIESDAKVRSAIRIEPA